MRAVYGLIRRALFALDPETAHAVSLRAMKAIQGVGVVTRVIGPPAGPTAHCMGLTLPNAVGLAAGLDKDGDYIDALGALGFGFLELGTVTPRPQPGNPRPRLFRLTADRALINRFGFNNRGVDYLVDRLRARRYRGVVGVNIGKNRDTAMADAVGDYCYCLQRVHAHADYVVINVSSPNTPGLRQLQGGDWLDRLLAAVISERRRLAAGDGRHVPLVVKISPDMAAEEVATMARRLLAHGIDGVSATNTTTARDGLADTSTARETGGLSGAPLRPRAARTLEQLNEALGGRIPLIGVGGILSGTDAANRVASGASLIQVYTGLIYRGPGLIQECAQAFAPSAAIDTAAVRQG